MQQIGPRVRTDGYGEGLVLAPVQNRKARSLIALHLPRIIGAFLALLFLALTGPAPVQAQSVAIVDVGLVDVEAGRVRPRVTVITEGDRIIAVGEHITVPTQARRIDGRGHFLIPGLWDMHTHHQASGEASLPLFIANGVTSTRDMGSDASFILPLREQIARGIVSGPRIFAAGPILDAAPANWPWRLRVTTRTEAVAAVIDLHAAGADLIKVHDRTPREAYFAIVEEAHRQGLDVVGHIPIQVSISEAIAAGQKSIEHFANFRFFTECQPDCSALYSAASRGHVWQTPTLVFMQALPALLNGSYPPSAYASPGLKQFWLDNEVASAANAADRARLTELANRALAVIPEMRAQGVQFLAGCDALLPGFCLHDELEWFTRAGMTPAEALRTATLHPVLSLGLDANESRIAPGGRADLVLLDANPLSDIRNTRRIRAVIQGSRVYDLLAIKRMLADTSAAFGTAN